MNYFAKIKYLGTDFHGFGVQPGLRTVQGELCTALGQALGVNVLVTGSSRTDAKVHANEMCIRVTAEGATVPPEKLPIACIPFLPNDISLFWAKECDNDFHPRYDAKGKEYLYRILNSKVPDPFFADRAWHLPRIISDEGLAVMRKCAAALIGRHDFSAFMSAGSDVSDTVRDIKYLDIKRQGDFIEVRICADGFLYNMVRIIVGTLVECAFGRFCAEDIVNMIKSKSRSQSGMTAPPEGLYLNRVFYEEIATFPKNQ